jgi:hypothetical protein
MKAELVEVGCVFLLLLPLLRFLSLSLLLSDYSFRTSLTSSTLPVSILFNSVRKQYFERVFTFLLRDHEEVLQTLITLAPFDSFFLDFSLGRVTDKDESHFKSVVFRNRFGFHGAILSDLSLARSSCDGCDYLGNLPILNGRTEESRVL